MKARAFGRSFTTDLPVSVFPKLVMYFGGVSAAVFDTANGLASSADPRREGGTCIYEH